MRHLENVTKKVYNKFHEPTMITNEFKIGGTVAGWCANFSKYWIVENKNIHELFQEFTKNRNTPVDNVARKACTMFHEATTIRKDFKIGGTMAGRRANFSKSQNVDNRIFLEMFLEFSKNTKYPSG